MEKKFYKLRKKYPSFIYKNYIINENDDSFEFEYEFEIEGLVSFKPKWSIKKVSNVNLNELNEFVFSLGLVELISYWKATCSPIVRIDAGYLNEEQINWWKKLYYNGLLEFFYTNDIKTDMCSFMDIEVKCNKVNNCILNKQLHGSLIPVGGGKDSIVTLDLLKDSIKENNCYLLYDKDISRKEASIAGFKSENIICAFRTIDNNLIELNKKGFLNGHTPFSALLAFSSILIAYLYGNKYVVLSNEASANEPTVLNEDVNHQYSKSYEFEQDFNFYVKNYLKVDIKYFSLLRPLSEFQITEYFSKLKQYHYIFKSCNRGSKGKNWVWCCECSKCLYIFIMLSAFLDIEYLSLIFGENLLEKEILLVTLEELTGIKPNKPFECVGSRDEVNTSICICIEKLKNNKKEIPMLYKEYMKSPLYDKYKDIKNNYSKFYNRENNLPSEFDKIVKESFGL